MMSTGILMLIKLRTGPFITPVSSSKLSLAYVTGTWNQQSFDVVLYSFFSSGVFVNKGRRFWWRRFCLSRWKRRRSGSKSYCRAAGGENLLFHVRARELASRCQRSVHCNVLGRLKLKHPNTSWNVQLWVETDKCYVKTSEWDLNLYPYRKSWGEITACPSIASNHSKPPSIPT